MFIKLCTQCLILNMKPWHSMTECRHSKRHGFLPGDVEKFLKLSSWKWPVSGLKIIYWTFHVGRTNMKKVFLIRTRVHHFPKTPLPIFSRPTDNECELHLQICSIAIPIQALLQYSLQFPWQWQLLYPLLNFVGFGRLSRVLWWEFEILVHDHGLKLIGRAFRFG